MRTAVASGVDVAARGLRESLMQAEGISVRGAGGYILLGKRSDPMLWMAVTADRFELPICVEERKEDKEEHTWSEEPCSSFWDEVDKRMDRAKKRRRAKE